MHIEQWPTSRPVPYDRNPRRNEAAVERVAASIGEFGFRQPIVVDENDVILIGHTRLKAAQRLGLEEVPVHRATDLSAEQKTALRLADNRTGEYAAWDPEMLAAELKELKLSGYEMALTAFSVGQIRRYTDQPVNEPDRTGLHVEARSQPGDLWLCGQHRLLCGDATRAEDVARACGEFRPGMMVTDPPYGVDFDPTWRVERRESIAGDDRVDWSEAWALFPGDVAYVWHAGRHASEVQRSLESAGFEMRSQIIWAKNRAAMSRGHYHWQHEPCWYAVRNGRSGAWGGSRTETTLWEIPLEKFDSAHPTQKPVECMLRAIRNHEIKTVYDPFVGTGSTLIACEHEGRRCIDIEAKWIDVALARWEALTGQTAVRA